MRLKPLKAAPYIGVAILWLLSMAMLVLRHYGPYLGIIKEDTSIIHQAGSITPGEMPPFDEQWMGIYQKGDKIGYSMTKIEQAEEGYKAIETVYMKIKVMGREKDIKMTTDAFLDRAFKLRSFIFNVQSDVNMNIDAVVEGKGLVVRMDIAGVKSVQRVPIKDESYLSMSLQPAMLKRAIGPGEKIKLPVIEPSTLTQDVMELEFVERQTISVMGMEQSAFKLKGSFKGAEVFMWVTDKGEILKEQTLSFTFIKEHKEDAMNIGKPSIDLIADVSIPFNLRLPDGVGYLKVRLKGITLEGLELHGGTQKLTGDVLEIRAVPDRELSLPKTAPEDMDEYLQDEPLLQTKDLLIVSLAGEIVKGQKDPIKKARLIYEWVYKNIEKVPTISMPSALDVIKTRRGDCNEHTALYTALARASGIPTRIAVGIVYQRGHPSEGTASAFYYHAWPEIGVMDPWVTDPNDPSRIKWIAIDPTLGQFPADATHIRLLTGGFDKQIQLLSVIGKLRIEGIEYK